MEQSSFSRLSSELAALAASSASRLFHVPSPAGGRSALGFDGRILLVPAFEAEAGEELDIRAPGGKPVRATVKGFDPRLGLAALELAEALPATAFEAAPGPPALGSLVLAVAFPSPQGPESRLEAIRFVSPGTVDNPSGEDACIQTDGSSFPGFSGGALVSPDGRLAGYILADRPGNHGYAIPAPLAARLAGEIARGERAGFAFLGLSTVPVPTPEGWSDRFGDGREEALLVAGLDADGPAAKAGILPGDFLVAIGGRAVRDPGELRAALEAARPGSPLPVRIVRAGAGLDLEATPVSRPGACVAGPGYCRGPRGEGRQGGHGWSARRSGCCE